MSKEECSFCMPNADLMLDAISDDKQSLRLSLDHIEMWGQKLQCGEEMTVCEPLKLIQQRIDRIDRNKRRTGR